MKKNAYDIKEDCRSNTEELRKNILYLETYSRRENLKFVGIPESTNSSDEDVEKSSEDTMALVQRFMKEELSIANPHIKLEF